MATLQTITIKAFFMLDDGTSKCERPHDYDDPEAEAAEFVASTEYPELNAD